MTPERALELLPIFEAFANGEEIQWEDPTTGSWLDCEGEEAFPARYEFRIKPKAREFYIAADGHYYVSKKDYDSDNWADVSFIKVVEVL